MHNKIVKKILKVKIICKTYPVPIQAYKIFLQQELTATVDQYNFQPLKGAVSRYF
jgi:hypothetical protein